MNFLFTLLPFLAIIIAVITYIGNNWNKHHGYHKAQNIYVRVKDIPEGVHIQSNWFMKVWYRLRGVINLRKTKLVTSQVNFTPPTYSDGTLLEPYQTAYLFPHRNPAGVFSHVSFLTLIANRTLRYVRSKVFKMSYDTKLSQTMEGYRVGLKVANNTPPHITKQVSSEAQEVLFSRALASEPHLTAVTRKHNRSLIWFLSISTTILLISVILRQPFLGLVPIIVMVTCFIAYVDRNSPIFSWLFLTRRKYVADKTLTDTLLPLLSYRNYLQGLMDGGTWASYTNMDSYSVWEMRAWAYGLGMEDFWLKEVSPASVQPAHLDAFK